MAGGAVTDMIERAYVSGSLANARHSRVAARSVISFSPGAPQVLMAVVKVSRLPNGSVTVMSRVPQGMVFTLGRACR